MTATLHPSGRRAAATWVGATGAFLLLAAAGVFVAVRWEHIPDSAKLALVAGLTGAFLLAARSLRRTLPATGEVLFHLGAFLVPVDLAAACVRLDVGWRATLVAEGVVGVALFASLARATSSVVLERAAIAAVLVLAAGVAAVSPVPAPLVLAAVAVAAQVARRDRASGSVGAATVCAAVAGLAPVMAAVGTTVLDGTGSRLGTGTLGELGLAGRSQLLAAGASGLLAAFVLARQAAFGRDVRLAFLAAASLAVGAGTAGTAAQISLPAWTVALAGAFLLVEVGALMAWDDDFWGRPAAAVAEFCEGLASLASAAAACTLFFAPLLGAAGDVDGSVTVAAALVLLALGWLAADVRRFDPGGTPLAAGFVRGSGWLPATLGIAAALPAAVMAASASAVPTAVALAAVPVALVAASRPRAGVLAVVSATWAVLTAYAHPVLMPALGLAGALAGAWAVARTTSGRERLGVAASGTVLAAGSALAAAGWLGAPAAACLSAAFCWLVAVALDRARGWGDAGRIGLAVPLLAASYLTATEAIPVLTLVITLYAVDAVRLGHPVVALGAAGTVQPLIVALAVANGLPLAWAGFALCVCAVAWAGVATVVDGAWRAPFVVAAGAGVAGGLALASGNGQAFADALLVAGGLGIAAGFTLRVPSLAHAGGLVTIGGLASHLAMAGVTASEAYVAPVAAHLLLAGWQVRRGRQASSWVAYTPAVALLGGAALLERMAGGAGWHAVLAGAVGVAAVAAGGWRRLAGPMVAGTALLALLCVHESMATLAGVPTWGWLALGGTVLLGTAVLLERSDTSPVEAGRRLVDVLAERFV